MKELSKLLDGKLVGNPDIIVSKPSKIEEGGEGSISFCTIPAMRLIYIQLLPLLF